MPLNLIGTLNKEPLEDSLEHAASPLYGKDIKDELYYSGQTDTNTKKYDPFRTEPLEKEKDPYSEFRKIPSRKKRKEANIETQETKVEEVKEKIKEEITSEAPTIYTYEEDKEEKVDPSVHNEIFNVEKPKEEFVPKPKERIRETPKYEDIRPVRATEYVKYDDSEEDLNTNNDVEYSMQELAIINSGHISPSFKNFKLPPLSILKEAKAIGSIDKEWIEKNIVTINENLEAFKIDGQVVEYTSGPTFTRYSIMLGAGVSGSKIESISNDLQRSLEAISIRIENPIPGKPYVGVEVPNKVRRSVALKELLDREEFLKSEDPLLIPVGLDVEGNCKYISISSLPHGLIAGSSGSGKSVFLNTIVASIIYKNTPEEVRFFFIDPKKVDLQAYSKIPHLLSPIPEDVKGGVESIRWLIEEMERRFSLFKICKCANIKTYKQYRKTHPEFRNIPYIVAIIDEAGDFLMNGGNEAMDLVTKLIQKSRAAGIHILISTQKPVAKILSTSIKSNASGRFALRVPSYSDSSIILDSGGAEKLLGNGDMIFSLNGISGRFQSAFVSDEEIRAITDFVERQSKQDFFFSPEELGRKDKNTPGTVSDELFPDVARYVVREGRCSGNAICQEFEIGFNRSNDIIKALEYYNVVSESKGTRARDILMDEEELEELLAKLNLWWMKN